VIYLDAIKSRKCLWFQEVVVRFDLMRNGAIGARHVVSVEERSKEDDMATVAFSVPHSNSEHIAAAVREEQRAYTFKMAVSMALYACLFFVLAFCGPYVLPAITLFSDAPLTDRQVAASQLLLLSDTVWVAIPVFFLGAFLFSLLVTRRIGDALERMGQSARAWASGMVSHRLQFREADRLKDLAQLLNQGWSQVGQGIETMQQESSRARAAVDGAVKIISAQGVGGSDALRQLQTATEALDRIQAALRRFEIGPSHEPRRS
jgi:methyl-accepting chemotaxis protein